MMRRNRVSAIAVLVLLVAMLSGLMVSPASGQQAERVDVFIGFHRTPGPAEQALVRGLGGEIRYSYWLVPAVAASIPEAAVEGLLRNPNVTAVEPILRVYAVDAELDNTWGVERIGAGTVHGAENLGTDVKVGIIDSGIDYTHPDLEANYAGGHDFVDGDDDPMDVYGHGTHVAGTACAEDNGFGVVGVAPECALYSLRVLDDAGSGYWSDIVAAMEWAMSNGIQVANLSLGSDRDPGVTVRQAFANAEAAGLLTVAAAGNSGNPAGRGNNVIYPARYDSVIAVAATDSSDARASFSSTGDQVELAAPGVAVYSTWNDGDSPHDPQPECVQNEGCYKYGSGTSMASPHVAGTAALIIAGGVTDADGNGRINDEVRLRLQETADDLGAPGRDPQYGYGLVDAAEAAAGSGPPADSPPSVTITSPTDGTTFDSGAAISFAASASDAEDGDLTASLVWTSDQVGQIGTGGSFTATLSDGTHVVEASVADSAGNIGSTRVTITVGSGGSDDGGDGITLSVTAYKVRGSQYADLEWSGATSTQVDIHRDGSLVANTENDGAYTDSTGQKGGGSATYWVCEADSATCSNEVAVTW